MTEVDERTDHEVNTEEIGVWGDEATIAVTRDAIVAYAAATNDTIAAHVDGTYAPPVYAVVPPTTIMAERTMSAMPDELLLKILHGEHDFRFHRPIVAGDELVCRAKVVGVQGVSSGIVVTTLLETRDAANELVNEQYFIGFFRGGRLSQRLGEPAPEHTFPAELRDREPDFTVVQRFDDDQTFRYAEAAGDPMPIHLDDEFAKQMGLPGIIIHGLCTNAFVSHAVIANTCPDDPSRLKRLAVRFSKPARPGEQMTTSIWRVPGKTGENGEDGTEIYAFESTSDDGSFLIKDGLAEVAPATH